VCPIQEIVEENNEKTYKLNNRLERGKISDRRVTPLNHQIIIEEEEQAYPQHGEDNTNDHLADLKRITQAIH
jgi:hypothetical protein